MDSLAEHHAELAKMATSTAAETAVEPAWTGSVNLRELA
ncbi:protein of unassigned function [Methylobacterium oryzae CBMB20]|uniref:Protein of unassigned function n=1 Tax=Methylobacterium oryzae CBMB20 TaxID=693986 RepID=A0A089NQ92_9HYPH|nr:protein of unassigned function [Methylobacterium oryzae CBMB20]